MLVFEPRADGGHDVTLYFRERADRTTRGVLLECLDRRVLDRPASGARRRRRRPRPRDRAHRRRSRPATTTSSSTSTTTSPASSPSCASSRTTTRSRRCSSRSRSPRAASTTSSRTSRAIIEHPRGERIVEGVFHQRARSDGNTVGYDTIAASGPHACYLHWTRNDGAVVPGDLILIDAGVEVDSLYTADITRTHPGQRPLHRGAAPRLRDRARGRGRGVRRRAARA